MWVVLMRAMKDRRKCTSRILMTDLVTPSSYARMVLDGVQRRKPDTRIRKDHQSAPSFKSRLRHWPDAFMVRVMRLCTQILYNIFACCGGCGKTPHMLTVPRRPHFIGERVSSKVHPSHDGISPQIQPYLKPSP